MRFVNFCQILDFRVKKLRWFFFYFFIGIVEFTPYNLSILVLIWVFCVLWKQIFDVLCNFTFVQFVFICWYELYVTLFVLLRKISKSRVCWNLYLCMQVAKDPSGKEINALEQHIKNLLNPSTPLFFNTLYDPYREGADFVRGYPFSLREGVPTAVSHGLWLNIPDYDAPTQLAKPLERNTRYNEWS